MHVTYEAVNEKTPRGESSTWHLAEDEQGWNPVSTKRHLYGPATVIYTHYSDGGWDARVLDAEQTP